MRERRYYCINASAITCETLLELHEVGPRKPLQPSGSHDASMAEAHSSEPQSQRCISSSFVRIYVSPPHSSQPLRTGDKIAFSFLSRRSQPPNLEARAALESKPKTTAVLDQDKIAIPELDFLSRESQYRFAPNRVVSGLCALVMTGAICAPSVRWSLPFDRYHARLASGRWLRTIGPPLCFGIFQTSRYFHVYTLRSCIIQPSSCPLVYAL
jgi:hypothetical protein